MAVEPLTTVYRQDWYALFVKTGSEKAIQHKLNYLAIDQLDFHVPCRQMRIRSKGKWTMDLQPMFPGYILVNGRLTDASYTRVSQIAGVYYWISDASGPLRIHPDEIQLICRLIDSNDVIRPSMILCSGQRITVVDGPLQGLEAMIKKVDHRKGRVKIALSVFGTERLVDIPVEDVLCPAD